MRVVRGARRVRLIDRGDVVSDLLHEPGPTDDLFDVLAAAVVATLPGDRFAMLGFAAGGVLAPLRALGFDGPVHAVDASDRGLELFREHAASWAGAVHFSLADARAWLARRRALLDGVLEDLSTPAHGGHEKPGASFHELPRLVRQRLATRGVSIVNVLPPTDRPWTAALRAVVSPWRRAVVISGRDWDNRITVAGDRLRPAAELSTEVRRLLSALGSNQAARISVRRFE